MDIPPHEAFFHRMSEGMNYTIIRHTGLLPFVDSCTRWVCDASILTAENNMTANQSSSSTVTQQMVSAEWVWCLTHVPAKCLKPSRAWNLIHHTCSQDVSMTYPVTYPFRNLLVMERAYHRYMYLQHGETGTIPTRVGIIHMLLHRLGWGLGNQRQLPFVPIQWVTDRR